MIKVWKDFLAGKFKATGAERARDPYEIKTECDDVRPQNASQTQKNMESLKANRKLKAKQCM